MWSVYMVGYYSALLRKEILMDVVARMNLEDVLLGQTSQSREESIVRLYGVRGVVRT